MDRADSIHPRNIKSAILPKDSKYKVKSGDWLDMETNQAEPLDTHLYQSSKVLNKHQDTEEADASTNHHTKIGTLSLLIINIHIPNL